MDWIEIIELRSYNFKPEILRELKLTVVEEEHSEDLKTLEIYFNASIDTDTSIHIHWQTKERGINKSTLGLHIALSLKQFGRVNHSIWIMDSNDSN